jgi:hypothetical protein
MPAPPHPDPLPPGFIAPCLPSRAPEPPSGSLWVHEIKHDGIRCIARKNGAQVRLYSRPGNDLTDRFSLVVEAVAELRCRSCMIDGEDEPGMARFDRIRYRRHYVQQLFTGLQIIVVQHALPQSFWWHMRRTRQPRDTKHPLLPQSKFSQAVAQLAIYCHLSKIGFVCPRL